MIDDDELPDLVEFEDAIEIQLIGPEVVHAAFKRRLREAIAESDKDVIVDMTGLTTIPLRAVRRMLKTEMQLKQMGRALRVRSSARLQKAIQGSTYGKHLTFEADDPLGDDSVVVPAVADMETQEELIPLPSSKVANLPTEAEDPDDSPEATPVPPPSRVAEASTEAEVEALAPPVATAPTQADERPGYVVETENRLVVLDPDGPWFERQALLGLIEGLRSTRAEPAVIDLCRIAEAPTGGVLKRLAYAALHLEQLGRPIRIHVIDTHREAIVGLGLDRLLQLELFPADFAVRKESDKIDASGLEKLLTTADALPEKVTEKAFEQFDKGSYTHKLRTQKRTDPQGVAIRKRTEPAGIPVAPDAPPDDEDDARYGGPDRRRPTRFSIRDALLRVHRNDDRWGEEGSLVDLSQGGSKFFSTIELHADEPLDLVLEVPDFVGELEMTAKVVWVEPMTRDGSPGWHVGVKFTSISGGSMVKLRRLEGKHR